LGFTVCARFARKWATSRKRGGAHTKRAKKLAAAYSFMVSFHSSPPDLYAPSRVKWWR
jgi:hypothetical protein